jgi:hypothetical protein
MTNDFTSQPAPIGWVGSDDHAGMSPRRCPVDAVINARIGRGRDWVAYVDISERYGMVVHPPEYWRRNYIKRCGCRQTINLGPDSFVRARLSGQHLGLYIDVGGQIHCFQRQVFLLEHLVSPTDNPGSIHP